MTISKDFYATRKKAIVGCMRNCTWCHLLCIVIIFFVFIAKTEVLSR